MPKIEENGKRWLRGPKLYKRVVEPHKKKKKSKSRKFIDKKSYAYLCINVIVQRRGKNKY